jgi:two-component system, OmpR family, KDP operon response regulator KdpE
MSLQVLLVEDDRELRGTLSAALRVEGYRVVAAASLADARAATSQGGQLGKFDLVLLDLGLPDGDGEVLLTTLQAELRAPVIVISARHTDAPKIRLLDAGADDYLVKPFSVGEMLARMRVALRHKGRLTNPAVTRYAHDGLEVDVEAYKVWLHGEPVHLTPTEFKLLARLVRRPGQVVTHRQLLLDVWGEEFTSHTHYLRLYMGQLRAKLEANPADPQLLLTEPGVGYTLVDAGT